MPVVRRATPAPLSTAETPPAGACPSARTFGAAVALDSAAGVSAAPSYPAAGAVLGRDAPVPLLFRRRLEPVKRDRLRRRLKLPPTLRNDLRPTPCSDPGESALSGFVTMSTRGRWLRTSAAAVLVEVWRDLEFEASGWG